jgi:hypothetical protein
MHFLEKLWLLFWLLSRLHLLIVKIYFWRGMLYLLLLLSTILIFSWSLANCISNTSLVLSSFYSWNALKVSHSANFRIHYLAKCAASNHVFRSIPIRSPIFSSIKIYKKWERSTLVILLPYLIKKERNLE